MWETATIRGERTEETMSAETPFANPLQRLTRMQQGSNDTERKIAAFVLENLTAIPSWSISEFAQRVNVSETTVVRFCRALGYNGYREFRMEMAQNAGALRASIDLGTEDRKSTRLNSSHVK